MRAPATGPEVARPEPARNWWASRRFAALSVGLLVWASAGQAADPVAYSVVLAPTGDAAIDGRLRDASTLLSLRETAPVGSFALLARARADADRFATVLQSDGYYASAVTLRIDGRNLDDPALADRLDALHAGSAVPVQASFERGPQFHLRRVRIDGAVPPAVESALGLASGDAARAADVLAARQRLEDALHNAGYALARVDPPVATLAPAERALDVGFAVRSGPRVDLGAISFFGLDRLKEAYVRRRFGLVPGMRYDPAVLEKARAALAASGAVAGVRIVQAEAVDADGKLPVRIEVTERPLRSVSATIGFSTDLGGMAGVTWLHRDLWGGAEALTLSAAATNLGGTASVQPGYNVGAQLVLPDWQRRDQSLTFQLTGIKESLQAYDRTAAIAATTLNRKLTDRLTASIGIAVEQARFVQEKVTTDYSLAQLPLGLIYDSTISLFDPASGIRASTTVTPSTSFAGGQGMGARNAQFVIAQGSVAHYLDLGALFGGAGGRSILATRALLGGIEGATRFEIPPDQRFYAGGSATVRGYRYQSVGPKFADNKPTGGTAIDAASIELRQRVYGDFGFAVFVDAGQVSTGAAPFAGKLDVGAGVGARYFTSIGPIRLDIAVPLVRERKSDAIEFYIGIGQAF